MLGHSLLGAVSRRDDASEVSAGRRKRQLLQQRADSIEVASNPPPQVPVHEAKRAAADELIRAVTLKALLRRFIGNEQIRDLSQSLLEKRDVGVVAVLAGEKRVCELKSELEEVEREISQLRSENRIKWQALKQAEGLDERSELPRGPPESRNRRYRALLRALVVDSKLSWTEDQVLVKYMLD